LLQMHQHRVQVTVDIKIIFLKTLQLNEARVLVLAQ
jgi:hypothetical protein